MTKEEQFLKVAGSKKQEITKLFEDYKQRDPKGFDFTSCHGELSIEDLIDSHAEAWIKCNFKGGSSSMVYYAEDTEVIKYMSKIWKEYTNIIEG